MILRSFLIGFVGFAVLLSFKDFVFRYLLVHGMSVGLLLFLSGFGSLLFGIFFSMAKRQPMKPKRMRYQVFRFILNGLFWIAATKGLQLLNATSVAIVSKAYLPLLILGAPFLKTNYSKLQRMIAFVCLFAMVALAFVNRDESESLLGYLYILIAVLLVMGEYIMLRQSVKDENSFVLAATPALACILFGAWMILYNSVLPELQFSQGILALFAGIAIYGSYFVSVYRYKILPLGLAEYPTVLTALLILPAEHFFFKFSPSGLYIFNLAIVIVLLGFILYLNTLPKKPINP